MDRRLLRFKCGFITRTVAKYLGVSDKKVRNYERGRQVLGKDARRKLRLFYDVYLPTILRRKADDEALLQALIPLESPELDEDEPVSAA